MNLEIGDPVEIYSGAKEKFGILWGFVGKKQCYVRSPSGKIKTYRLNDIGYCPTQDIIKQKCAEIRKKWKDGKDTGEPQPTNPAPVRITEAKFNFVTKRASKYGKLVYASAWRDDGRNGRYFRVVSSDGDVPVKSVRRSVGVV
jgi:hypothetical protein